MPFLTTAKLQLYKRRMDINLITYFDDMESRRTTAGLTIQEICRRSGIAETTYHRWRKSQVEPSLANLRAVMRVLRRREKRMARGGT